MIDNSRFGKGLGFSVAASMFFFYFNVRGYLRHVSLVRVRYRYLLYQARHGPACLLVFSSSLIQASLFLVCGQIVAENCSFWELPQWRRRSQSNLTDELMNILGISVVTSRGH